MSGVQESQVPQADDPARISAELHAAGSACAGPRLSLRPISQKSGYSVRAFGSSAGSRLVRMTQCFDPGRGGFVPETFIRGVSSHGMRLLTYVVAEIIDVWQIPIPWWKSDGHVVTEENGQDCIDREWVIAPLARTVWRVSAIPTISFAGYHMCGSVMDIAHDPDGTWSVVRIHD